MKLRVRLEGGHKGEWKSVQRERSVEKGWNDFEGKTGRWA